MGRKKKKKKYEPSGNKTKVALTPEEIERIKKAAKEFGKYQGIDVYQCIMVFLYTGMHPVVLADIKKSRLRRVDNELQWFRPKKSGQGAITKVPIHRDLEPWIEDFIYSDLPTYRIYYWHLVKMVGLRSGLPELSPMSLRHTFGCMLDDLGFTPAEIMELMNCSIQTLMKYTSRTRKDINKKMQKIGWTVDGDVELKQPTPFVEDPRETIKKDTDQVEFRYHAKNVEWYNE